MLLVVQGVGLADEHEPIGLSRHQRSAFNTFFSCFSGVNLTPFVSGQLSDDELIRFGLSYIKRNHRELIKENWWISPADVDEATAKFFGKVVREPHSISNWPLIDGSYKVDFQEGDSYFSRLQNLYDNGDGTFTATVYVYSGDVPEEQFQGLYDNGDGTYVAVGIYVDPQGNTKKWSTPAVNLLAEYKARLKPVFDGGSKRYVLLEYIKTRDFLAVQGGKTYRTVPNPLPRDP